MKTLKDTIMNAEINTYIDLTEFNICFSSVKFIVDDNEYSWNARSSRNKYMTTFPMKDANYVKFFKTINGAKRNFLKRFDS